MPEQEPTQHITERLKYTRKRLYRRQTVPVCVYTLGFVACALLLLEAVNRLSPLKEHTAAAVISLILAGGALYVLSGLIRVLFYGPSIHQLALRIEHACPAFMDSFMAATEAEMKPNSERGVLEKTLVQNIYRDTENLDLTRRILPADLKGRYLITMAVLFGLLAALAFNTASFQKFRFQFSQYAGLHVSGLEVRPGSADVAKNRDVSVHTRVLRWQNNASIRYKREGEGWQRSPMNRSSKADNEFQFTFYNVKSPLTYQVSTPSLESPEYRLTVYKPPRLKNFVCRLDPPDYTGKDRRTIEHLKDVSALEGTEVHLQAAMNTDGTVFMAEEDSRERFSTAAKDQAHTLSFTLRQDRTFSLLLRDREGHKHKTKEMQIECSQDIEPAINLVRPAEDVVRRPDRNVLLKAAAGDDFGITRVQMVYTVSGGKQHTVALYPEESGDDQPSQADYPQDLKVQHKLDLSAAGASEGAVVSYFFEAVDNREPEPQKSRSEVYFIEVRPEFESEKGKKESQGQKKTVEIQKLIAETKRLIRLTYRAQSGQEQETKQVRQKLATGLADLKTQASKMLGKMKSAIPRGDPEEYSVVKAFNSALEQLDQAAAFVDAGAFSSAISSEENALSTFTSIAQMIMKNQKQASGEGGKGQQQQKKKSAEQKKKRSSRKKSSYKEQRQKLKQAQKKLEQLAEKQERWNKQTKKFLDTKLSETEKRELINTEKRNRNELEQVTNQIAPEETDADALRRKLEEATDAMDKAAGLLKKDRKQPAYSRGFHAEQQLQSAINDLREKRRRLAANRLQALAKATQRSAEAQRKAADKSREAAQKKKDVPDKALKKMKKDQKTLKEQTEKLLRKSRQSVDSLRKDYPRAAKALQSSLEKVKNRNVQQDMKRAQNALNYSLFKQAKKHQTDAANALRDFSGKIREAANRLPSVSPEALADAMQKLKQEQARLKKMAQNPSEAGSQVRKLQRRSGHFLKKLAEKMDSKELEKTAGSLRMAAQQAPDSENIKRTSQILRKAQQLLQKRLMKNQLDEHEQMLRRSTAPPKEYRRLIQEYFKRLSE